MKDGIIVLRKFWKSSISKRLLGGFFVVLIPIILISLGVNYASMEIVKKEVSNSYINSILLLSGQINNSLNNFDATANLIFSDSDLNALNQSSDKNDNMWEYVNFREKLRLYERRHDLKSNIGVYLKNKDRFLSSHYGGIPTFEGWIDPVIKEESMIPKYRWHFRTLPGNFGGEFLTYVWESTFRDLIVIVDIDIQPVKELLNKIENQGGGTAFLLDSNGEVLYSALNAELDQEVISQKIMKSKDNVGQFSYKEEGKEYMILFNQINSTGLVLGMYFQEEEVMQPILKIQNWILVILAISIALGIFFVVFSYKTLLVPVYKLIAAMQEVRNGDLKVRIQDDDQEELGFIFTQFNHMVSRIDTLINEVYIERLKQQQAQLKFLQSQINPHFLYNCLNFIYLMSIQENNEASAKMALFLEKYFRFATKSQKESVMLRDEINNVISYIEIQKMRFPGRVNLEMDIPDDIMNLYVPRLIIQPIIENAFVHGFEEVDTSGQIWITGRKDNNKVILTIEDNGSCISKEEVEAINGQMNKKEEDYNGHGLANIHWRLKLKFGEESGIYLAKRSHAGLKVILTIAPKEGGISNV